MSKTKLTPMLEQYLRIKEDYPDALLFFRMGDFYELFFEDAETAARVLQITLTSRNPNAETKVPMAGVPHHATEEYLRQLLEQGYKVAICDQVEDPRQAKGLVKREVTRVLTPGTVVEDSTLSAKTSNYLAAVCWHGGSKSGAAAWIDFSTGQWTGVQSKHQVQLWQWLIKIQPQEVLIPEGTELPEQAQVLRDKIQFCPYNGYFEPGRARERLLQAQDVASLTPLDLEDKPALVQACGALLAYLHTTQRCEDLSHLGQFQPIQPNRFLQLDEVTERNLELFQRLDGGKGPGTLWHALDRTLTPMGGRLLQQRLRQPWRDLRTITAHQDVVALLVDDDGLRQSLRERLDAVYDLERLTTRIFLGRCTPKDFIALRNSLKALPALQSLLEEDRQWPELLGQEKRAWDNLDDVRELLERSLVDAPPLVITEGGLFRHGFDPELDELLDLSEDGEGRLQELLHKEQQASSLPKLKLGYNRVFGYYFELSKAHKGPVPDHFIRRQTLVNAERYITEELKTIEDKVFSAAEKRKGLEYNLFQNLREQVAAHRERVMAVAGILARLDYWQGLAHAARQWEWSRPELHSGLDLRIIGGRHPAVEATQGRTDYIPNDVRIEGDDRVLLITGPNMAGKSTVLRQTAIICILAQIGSFVPAREGWIGLCDRIFTRVGASDNLAQGQSTFMVEMTETARILRQASRNSLVILDEIGRGTSTFDGLALAWAVVEDLVQRGHGGVRTLFATHYHELTDLEGQLPGVRNYNIAVKEWRGDIVFLRRLVPGPADRSYGIEVSQLAGVPQGVVKRAKAILAQLEEKSRGLRHTPEKGSHRQQSLLPGLFDPPEKPQPEPTAPQDQGPHPLEEALQELDLNGMTPLDALNLLSRWKHEWTPPHDSQDTPGTSSS